MLVLADFLFMNMNTNHPVSRRQILEVNFLNMWVPMFFTSNELPYHWKIKKNNIVGVILKFPCSQSGPFWVD